MGESGEKLISAGGLNQKWLEIKAGIGLSNK
jgi:hypothetical protein